ncbi:unnamed protein product [Xylocopa violacea]|uniref:Reverse transcriptase domain-containing protein n=1 Tax=Xylocopa violacea TaxID=135666 RepID=A0ABP1MW58_XYLVO
MPLPTRARWTDEETTMLAREEARLTLAGERFINQALNRIFHPRTIEAIKGHRRGSAYKTRVLQFINEMTSTDPTSAVTTPPQADHNNNEDPIQLFLRSLPRIKDNNYQAQLLQDIIDHLTTSPREETLQQLTTYLRQIYPTKNPKKKKKTNNNQDQPRTRRKLRRQAYALTQLQWLKNRRRCVANILDGTNEVNQPAQNVMEPYWKEVMSHDSSSSPEAEDPPNIHSGLWAPISEVEIKDAFLPTGTAKGPDEISSRQLRATPLGILQRIFNIILLCRRLPRDLRVARTVFLPKSKDAHEPGDFRPITIPSVLTRCLHRVLASRLSSTITIDDRQRAFRNTDGCRDNIFLLDVILKYHNKMFKDVYMASLDVQRAFDSVSHVAIATTMRTLGCPEEFIEYVNTTYNEGTTTLEGAGWKSKPIRPRSGVKQGDPLSPMLFNMVMHQLLKKLPPQIGCRIGDTCINAAAFADDLFLFATTPKGLQELINTAAKYLKNCGMNLNPGKCLTIGIKANGKLKKTAVDINTKFYVDGRVLRTLERDQEIKYLGVRFSAQGRRKFKPHEVIGPGLESLTKAPLKPQQRLFALRTGLIPRVYYHLALGDVTISALKGIDVQIRHAVRKWLNLPHDVPTAYFHADVKDGGLGVPSLRWLAPLHRLNRLQSLLGRRLQLPEEPMNIYIREETNKCQRRLTDGTLMKTLDDVKKRWAKLLHATVDGQGLRESNKTPQQHQWISDGTRLLTGRDFLTCVKARIGALPTKSRTSRGRYVDRRCRAGCTAQETLNHVVQQCHRTHGMRVRRHDAIVAYISRNMKRQGYTVSEEPTFSSEEGTRKPDLVATMGRTTIVVDAQVVSEQTDLNMAHKRKVEYYSKNTSLLRNIGRREQSTDVQVLSATLSWRGIWSSKSAEDLIRLGLLQKKELKILSTRALIGTIAAFNMFSRVTTVRRVGVG